MTNKELEKIKHLPLFFMLVMGVITMLSTLLERVDEVHTDRALMSYYDSTYNRCPDYLKDQAAEYITDIEDFYSHVCTKAEELDIRAEVLLMCIDAYSMFNPEDGLTALSRAYIPANDQVMQLQFKPGCSPAVVYLLLVEGIYNPTQEDIDRAWIVIEEHYPTVMFLYEQDKKYNNRKRNER